MRLSIKLFLKNSFNHKENDYLCPVFENVWIMGISIDNIWAKAQRLSPKERLLLSRRLAESVTETEAERRNRVMKEMDNFFGGWSCDERTTEEIMAQIRDGRTMNTFPKL